MVWSKIKTLVCTGPVMSRYDAYFTKQPVAFSPVPRRWVIGEYDHLKKLATALRNDWTVGMYFGGACYGLRHTDVAPTGPQPKGGFRPLPPVPDHPVNQGLINMRQVNPNQTPRESDLYDKYRDFYAQKTLEAHHIVEKSILGTLGHNKPGTGLENHKAPCVLVVAELHQQMFTREVSKFRTSFHNGMSEYQQALLLTSIYKDLYASPQMADLLWIANIIIGQVGGLGRGW
jgi:hypothetical protein